MSLIVVSSERFAEHQTPPGHPERPERAEVMDVVAAEWRRRGGEVVAPREATRRAARSRPRRRLSAADRGDGRDRGGARPRHLHVARDLRDRAARRRRGRRRGRARDERLAHSRASRWCALPAITPSATAPWASASTTTSPSPRRTRRRSAPRVAIVDYDVHHGNGTQHIFEARCRACCTSRPTSIRTTPAPARRARSATATAPGFTVNLPLEAGAIDDDYHQVFDEVVVPVVRAVPARPDAGVGRLRRPRARSARRHAPDDRRVCGDDDGAARRGRRVLRRPPVAVTEGGYDLRALRDSLARRSSTCWAAEHSETAAWPTSTRSRRARRRRRRSPRPRRRWPG